MLENVGVGGPYTLVDTHSRVISVGLLHISELNKELG